MKKWNDAEKLEKGLTSRAESGRIGIGRNSGNGGGNGGNGGDDNFSDNPRDILLAKLANGELTKELFHDTQAPHIFGSDKYNPEKHKSYFMISESELQAIVDELHGMGDIRITNSGQIKETITFDQIIGEVIDPINGESLGKTKKFTIHYSNRRTHAVPSRME